MGTGPTGLLRGRRGFCGYGDEVHSLTAGMGPRIWGHHRDGINNLWGHHGVPL